MAVGRFQVMAMLQAARACELGLPMESAMSWGLNRAIFYAAAKRGFRGSGTAETRTGGKGPGDGAPARAEKPSGAFSLGDEVAFQERSGGKRFFTMGGRTQKAQDFERQVKSRFNMAFPDAWEDALDYVRRFPRETLLSRQGFYEDVYIPRRDELAKKWTELSRDALATAPIPREPPVRSAPSARATTRLQPRYIRGRDRT